MSDDRSSNSLVEELRNVPPGFNTVNVRLSLRAANEIERLQKLLDAKEQELEVSDKLIAERNRLLEAIPRCPEHGACVPHALEWVQTRLQSEPTVVREDADRIVELERECANAKESRNAEMRLRQSAEAAASVVLAKYWTRLQAIVGDMDSELNGSSSTKDAVASAPRCESCGRNQSDGPAHWPTCTAAETNGAQ